MTPARVPAATPDNLNIRTLALSLLFAGPALVPAAFATVLEDPDKGEVGDFYQFVSPAAGEEPSTARQEGAAWVATVRAERGIEAPLRPETASEARAELEEPPLAADEVRFGVDEEEGWIEYLIQDDTVSLYRGASVSYHDMTLTADRIRFYSGRDLVIAEGYCELKDPNQTMLGVRMSYDLENEKGVVLRGDAESAQGYYRGARIKKIEEKTFAAQRGSFTTCDLGHPHYHFWSPRLKIYAEDKVVARPAVLFAGEVPVAAAPFFFFSLRRERHSGFLPPYIRYYRSGEFEVNNGYYWVWNDFSDATFLLDYDATKGWKKSANIVYLYGSRSTVNNFYASHMRQRNTATEWWKIYATHRQDFSDSCAGLLKLDLRNSTAYDDYLEPEFEIRTEQDLESFANISQNWDDYQLSVEARHTKVKATEAAQGTSGVSMSTVPGHEVEPFGGTIQRTSDPFPRILFYAKRQELAETRFYYQYNANAVNYYDFDENESVLKQSTVDLSISRPLSLFRYFRVDPAANGHENWYDRDRFGPNNRFLTTWDTSVGLSTKVYGIFERGETVFRHIVNPTVTHSYRPEIDQTWMLSGGAVQEEQNSLALALRQSFDVKFPEKKEEEKPPEAEKGPARSWEDIYRPSRTGYRGPRGRSVGEQRRAATTGKVVNLAQWDTSTSYDLGPLGAPGQRRFGDLKNTLEVTPNLADWYFASTRLDFRNDFYDLSLLDFDVTTTFSVSSAARRAQKDKDVDQSWRNATDPYGTPRAPGDEDLDPDVYNIDTITGRRYQAGEGMGQGWTLSLTHDYNWSEYSGLHTLKGAFSFDLTKKWRLGYDAYYDIEKGELISEHYRLFRNLHRWEAEVRISFENKEVFYWFEVRLVDIPELQLYGYRTRTY